MSCRDVDWLADEFIQQLIIRTAKTFHLTPSYVHQVKQLVLEKNSSSQSLHFGARYARSNLYSLLVPTMTPQPQGTSLRKRFRCTFWQLRRSTAFS